MELFKDNKELLLFYLIAESPMEMPAILELVGGGILVIMVLRLVFDFINKQRMKNGANHVLNPYKQAGQIAALYKWHEPDPEGEQTWKNKQLIDMLKEIKVQNESYKMALENNTKVMGRLLPVLAKLEISMKT